MNEIVEIGSAKVPAFLKKNSSSLSEQALCGVRVGLPFPRISTRASRFRYIDGGVETVSKDLELRVVIIGANRGVTKMYYAAPWADGGDPEPPTCWSNDGVKPDPSVAEPVSDVCSTCPKNQFGSIVLDNAKKAKACSDMKRLAVVSADNPDGPVAMLSVSPSALSGFAKYVSQLVGRGIPLEGAITVVSFDEQTSYPKLVFRFGGFVDKEAFKIISDRVENDPTVKMITGSESEVLAAAGEAVSERDEEGSSSEHSTRKEPAAENRNDEEVKEAQPVEVEESAGEVADAEGDDDLMAKLNAILGEGEND